MATGLTQSRIITRKMAFKFPAEIEKHWLDGDPVKTHLMNAFTLFIPIGEEWLIRSVKKVQQNINDPKLLADARAFIGQEAEHLIQHKKFWSNLRKQGYRIDGFIKFTRFCFASVLEPLFGLRLSLSFAAGMEHFTDFIGEMALDSDILNGADAEMRTLFEWHAVEEIEHKAVVFDTFKTTSESYLLRVLGLVISHLIFNFFMFLGPAVLLWQDGLLLKRTTFRSMISFLFTQERFVFKSMKNAFPYFKKGFHPLQRENIHLARKSIVLDAIEKYQRI